MPVRTVAGESNPIRFSGIPCQSCTTNASRDRVAVDVAETVRDDDDARPCGEPEPPQRVLGRVRDAAGGGIPSLLRRTDEPDGGVAVCDRHVPERERAVGDADAAAEHPRRRGDAG